MPVVLLCHCDGTNGSTTFADVSASAHALTSTSALVSTTSPKFGTGSADFTAGSAARIVVGGSAADFNFGSGPFTVEAWGYFTSAPFSIHGVLSQFGGGSNLGWFFGFNGLALYFFYSTTGTDNPQVGQAFTPTLNQWYHLAADRDTSNVLRVYVNGAVIASATVSATIFPSTQACLIGNDNNNSRGFPGRLDEVRIVTGTAMYGGAFTPPTGPFSTAAATTWSTTDKSANMTLSGGNLIATAAALNVGVRGKDPKRTGKYYIEYTATTTQSINAAVGFATQATVLYPGHNACAVVDSTNSIRAWSYNGITAIAGTGPAFTTGSVVGCAIDLDAALVWFRLSPAGNWNNSAANNPATGIGGIDVSLTGLGRGIDAYPFLVLDAVSSSITANFGASAFTGAVPAGFTSGWDDSVAIVTNEIATQVGVEEWGSSVPALQATQVGVEEWGRSLNPGIVTQVSAEHWTAAAAPVTAITQVLVEQWGAVSTISTQAVVTQVAVEHWITEAAVSTARPRRVVCVSG